MQDVKCIVEKGKSVVAHREQPVLVRICKHLSRTIEINIKDHTSMADRRIDSNFSDIRRTDAASSKKKKKKKKTRRSSEELSYKNPENGDESGPGGAAVQHGQEELEGLAPEAADLCQLLLR
jgi:hypothetical protein